MASPKLVDPNGIEVAFASSDAADALARRLARVILGRRDEGTLHEVDGKPLEFLFDEELDGVRLVLIRGREEAPARPIVLLSPREREIARMVAKGYPNKTIAAVLEISAWTVCTYLRRIFAKLNVCSRAAMVAQLSESGLLAGESAGAPASPPRRR